MADQRKIQDGCLEIPSLVDLHVHFREPGNPEKETIGSGLQSALASGYGLVCTMPNLNPAPDCLENLKVQMDIISSLSSSRGSSSSSSLRGSRGSKGACQIMPFGCITKGRMGKEPADYKEMLPYVAGFSDDGSGVDDDALMEECMKRVAELGGLMVCHCEKGNGDDRQREWTEVERNIALSKKTGCRVHLCHISTKESIALIRKGKADGVKVSCETAPHYLLFSDDENQTLRQTPGGAYKMNPPIGTKEDRKALVEALCDGTIDVIATDHAPHTEDDKARGANGIVGLESAFPVMYTHFVRKGIITIDRLIDLMSLNALKILGIDAENWATVLMDVEHPFIIDASKFKSKGRCCPFDGWEVFGKFKGFK